MAEPARETAGTTISLVIRYVRHHAGDEGVARLLALAGETRPLADLEDEHRWSTYEQKTALFDAACAVLDDPDAVLHIGETALDYQIGPGIRMLVRRLGSPRVVLANVAKACPKFSTVATMRAEQLGRDFAVINYRVDDDKTPHRGDCQLNIGLMRTIGLVFGMPPLEVEHPECQVLGAPECRYIVTWQRSRPLRNRRRERQRSLNHQVNDLKAQLDQLQSTTIDLVSSDDIDEVLHRIVTRAGVAVSATGFALILDERDAEGESVYADGIAPEDLERITEEVRMALPGTEGGRIVIEVASSRRSYGRLAAFYSHHAFFAHEEQLLATYARSAAAALDVATALDQARRRGAATAALLGLARSLAEPASPERIARIVASAIPEILDVPAAAVLLLDRPEQTVRMAGRSGWPKSAGAFVDKFELHLSDSDFLSDLMASPRARLFEIATVTNPVLRAGLQSLGFPALAIAPLCARGDGFQGVAIAAVSVTSTHSIDSILERLAAVADQAAVALQNSALLEQIRHQAIHDDLTGLANRGLFDTELEKSLARAERDAASLSVLFIDLDDFKSVNDRFGHGAGDNVLRTVAQRLVEAGRTGDSIARLGGDEFAVLLQGATRAQAEIVIARLSASLLRPIMIGGDELEIRASIGIGCYPDDGDDPDALMRSADRSMYRTKHRDRIPITTRPSPIPASPTLK